MAWYCEYLIINSIEIRQSGDINSDIYSDLLSVEMAIVQLNKSGNLSSRDIFVLSSFMDLSLLGIDRKSNQIPTRYVVERLSNVANKIGNILGCHFTDQGYTEYLRDLYNLSDLDIEKAKEYMVSKYRHNLVRKSYRESNELA